MTHTYILSGNTLAPRPTGVGELEINMSEEEFQSYVEWYKEIDGNVPDFFDSPFWDSYMDEFNKAIGMNEDGSYIECSVDYPYEFLEDLEEAIKGK